MIYRAVALRSVVFRFSSLKKPAILIVFVRSFIARRIPFDVRRESYRGKDGTDSGTLPFSFIQGREVFIRDNFSTSYYNTRSKRKFGKYLEIKEGEKNVNKNIKME